MIVMTGSRMPRRQFTKHDDDRYRTALSCTYSQRLYRSMNLGFGTQTSWVPTSTTTPATAPVQLPSAQPREAQRHQKKQQTTPMSWRPVRPQFERQLSRGNGSLKLG